MTTTQILLTLCLILIVLQQVQHCVVYYLFTIQSKMNNHIFDMFDNQTKINKLVRELITKGEER